MGGPNHGSPFYTAHFSIFTPFATSAQPSSPLHPPHSHVVLRRHSEVPLPLPSHSAHGNGAKKKTMTNDKRKVLCLASGPTPPCSLTQWRAPPPPPPRPSGRRLQLSQPPRVGCWVGRVPKHHSHDVMRVAISTPWLPTWPPFLGAHVRMSSMRAAAVGALGAYV